MAESEGPLAGRLIALPESRQLDVMASLLERRGAETLRCPLLAIHDSPDRRGVERWLEEFIASPPSDFILLTGEGLRRLVGFAERAGRKQAFVSVLAGVSTLIRGPKPGAALRTLGLRPTLKAAQPTTEGVIETLGTLDLSGRTVAVQLYGSDPNERLTRYLAGQGIKPRLVAPYVYADEVEEGQVLALIQRLAAGEVNAIAFTSQPQVQRLFKVARKHDLETDLRAGLASTCVAVVGPLVGGRLEELGVRIDLMPEHRFFMKPLVDELARRFG
ncbi:MAG: uroporphyrinogen-III synthase [Gammaproteobacteria bacterium]|nr:uroporphyrinogen-III synthase [Gammaproteobacteria bacterium]